MNKNKKIILTIITVLVSTMLFINKSYAEKQTMGIKCDIVKSPYDENWVNDVITYNKDGEQLFVRLTDNKGEVFWDYLNNPEYKDDTIPNFGWFNDISITELSKMDEDELETYKATKELNLNKTFNLKYCPSHIVKIIKQNDYFLMDTSLPKEEPAYIENSKYIIYSYINDDGKEMFIAESYNNEGAYCFIGPDIKVPIIDEIVWHQRSLINNNEYVGYKNYFKVDEVYASLLIAGNGAINSDYSVCKKHSQEWCKQNKHFKIYAASSGEGHKNLENKISDWIKNKDNQNEFRKYDDIVSIVKDEEFMKIIKEIKENLSTGKEYNFDNTNLDELINKLEKSQKALDKAYSAKFTDCAYDGSKTDITSSITSCVVYSDMLGIRSITQLAHKNSTESYVNKGHIISALYNDVHDILENEFKNGGYEINILNSSEELSEYTELMYTAVAYLRSRANDLNIDKEKISDIYNEYEQLVKDRDLNIYPVVDCETLLGEELINKINSYLNIIKIAVPIIVIGFGIADFTKAVFSDEENMKKAQKQFIKRLIIAILIFLTPTFVNLLLSLANKVWTIISPNSCGIFN